MANSRLPCFCRWFHLVRNIGTGRHAVHTVHNITPGKEYSVYKCACGKHF